MRSSKRRKEGREKGIHTNNSEEGWIRSLQIPLLIDWSHLLPLGHLLEMP